MEQHYTATRTSSVTSARQATRLTGGAGYPNTRTPVATRFIQQSHAVSAPIASPRSLLLAATIAVALYFVGRRLSD